MVDKASHGGVSRRHGSPAEVVKTVLPGSEAIASPDERVNGEVPWRRESRKPGLPEASRENKARARARGVRAYIQVGEQAVNRVEICFEARWNEENNVYDFYNRVRGRGASTGGRLITSEVDSDRRKWVKFGFTSADSVSLRLIFWFCFWLSFFSFQSQDIWFAILNWEFSTS